MMDKADKPLKRLWKWLPTLSPAFVVLFLFFGQPITLASATPFANISDSYTNISYGKNPRQKLDLYKPQKPAPNHPAIVFFYGGGWKSGDRGDYKFLADALAEKGILVVIPDYRLYPEVKFPDFLQDAADSVVWTWNHVEEYGGNRKAIFVAGHSAGAYMAIMLALNPKYLAAAGISRNNLAGAIGMAGPYDFQLSVPSEIKDIFDVSNFPETQPITFADGKNPAMLLLTGDADTAVAPRNSSSLAQYIRKQGGPAQVILYPNLGHSSLILSFAALYRSTSPVINDITGFVTNHLAPR